MNFYNYLQATKCPCLDDQQLLNNIKDMSNEKYDMNNVYSNLNILTQDITLCEFIINYYEKVIR